jgi:hypothetical protein
MEGGGRGAGSEVFATAASWRLLQFIPEDSFRDM